MLDIQVSVPTYRETSAYSTLGQIAQSNRLSPWQVQWLFSF